MSISNIYQKFENKFFDHYSSWLQAGCPSMILCRGRSFLSTIVSRHALWHTLPATLWVISQSKEATPWSRILASNDEVKNMWSNNEHIISMEW
jgi:lipid-A-disaccharide synthase-like uncharacterized protein